MIYFVWRCGHIILVFVYSCIQQYMWRSFCVWYFVAWCIKWASSDLACTCAFLKTKDELVILFRVWDFWQYLGLYLFIFKKRFIRPKSGWLWLEPVGVMWQLELLVSEKISKQLWFQLHSDTVFVLLKDSQNTRKPISDILEKSLFGISQGSAATYFRWGGQIYNLLDWCNISSGLHIPKIIEIGPIWQSYSKKTNTPLTSTWPHLNSDVCLEEGEYYRTVSVLCSISAMRIAQS